MTLYRLATRLIPASESELTAKTNASSTIAGLIILDIVSPYVFRTDSFAFQQMKVVVLSTLSAANGPDLPP